MSNKNTKIQLINIYMPAGAGEEDMKGIEVPVTKGTTPSRLDLVSNGGSTGGTSSTDEGSIED
jgi:hypothetical protein